MTAPAEIVGERFELRRIVGSGGMGDVYQATDRTTGELVAVKILAAKPAGNALERFRREIQLLAEIHDPRVVRYVAHGLTREGRPFLAMEWLEGQELAERIAHGPMPVADAVALVRRIAEGLSVMHARGVVHRDIKPSNVFLVGGEVGRAKILDLGVARFVDASARATRTGVMVGTPGYMAPEQARGEIEIDARADVYALGCVLYECLTGEALFEGSNVVGILAKILMGDTPRVREKRREVPRELDDLLARMLARSPAERPADGGALAEQLAALPHVVAEPSGPSLPPPGDSRAITHTERRLVSVVLVGEGSGEGPPPSIRSTGDEATIAARLDPRLVAMQFSAELEGLADGALVASLTGKGTATDQAGRAARCALELRKHVGARPVVLATGFAARDSALAAREVIDRAAALLVHGDDRSVRLDEFTAGLLGQRFDVAGDDHGLVLLGLREEHTQPRTLLGRPMPFVGRDRELQTLLALARESDEDSCARPVLVTAPPGMGKTRLAHELVTALRKEGHAELWLARGDAMSEGSPFSVVGHALRACAGIVDGEPLVTRQKKLRARVARNLPEAEVDHVTEFLAEIIAAPFAEPSVQLRAARRDPRLMGDQMREAFEAFVTAECEARPVVVLLDDLQWGDLPSMRFLDAVLRNLEDLPLLVVGFGRPEVEQLFPGLWKERNLTEIRLAPLSKRSAEAFVRAALGESAAADRVRRILERGSGNAFFLEELVRAAADGREDFPATVLAMIESRLESLDGEARRVLRAASIFGLTFWARGITALVGAERAGGIDEWLAELQRRELVDAHASSSLLGETEYGFHNALVREAAYATFTAEDRALGHKLAAAWLENKGGGDPTALAEHWERGGERENALRWYTRAASHALEGGDFTRALDRAQRAIDLGASGPVKGRLRLIQASCAIWASGLDDAFGFGVEAVELLGLGSDEGMLAAGALASIAARQQRSAVLVDLARRVLAELGAGALSPERTMGAARVAGSCFFAGAFELGTELIDKVEQQGKDAIVSEPTADGWLQYARAMRATVEANPRNEHAALERAIESFEAAGDRRTACQHRINLGSGLHNLGLLELAEEHLRRALDYAERAGLASLALAAKHNLGAALARAGQTDRGIELEREAAAGMAAMGDRFLEVAARAYLGIMLRVSERYDEARAELEYALQALHDLPHAKAPVLAQLALIDIATGQPARALEWASEAVAIARAGGVFEGDAYARLAWAEALYANGRFDEAKEAIREARTRLLERAEKIPDVAWRKAFLERLREHAQTINRAREWLAD